MSGSKQKSTMKYYKMSLVLSFVPKLKGDERIDGDGLWLCFLYHRYGGMQANGVIRGEIWMSVGNDGMSMISLCSII